MHGLGAVGVEIRHDRLREEPEILRCRWGSGVALEGFGSVCIRVGTRILAMTPHPGRLAASFDVPVETRERGTSRFAALESHIQHSVFAERETEHA